MRTKRFSISDNIKYRLPDIFVITLFCTDLPINGEFLRTIASVINCFCSISERILVNPSLSGNNFLPKRRRNPNEIKSSGKPSLVSSNIPIGRHIGIYFGCSYYSVSKYVCACPKRVQQPPNIDAYETGISIFEEENSHFRDKEKTTGNNHYYRCVVNEA